MNAYLALAALLLAMLGPLLWLCLKAPLLDALVALQLAGTIVTLVLLLIAQGTGREPFFDLAIVSGALSFAGSLAFARFFERWV